MTGRRSHGRLSALNGVVHQGTDRPEAVDVGDLGRDWTFDRLNQAFRQLLNAARLVAIQKNRYWKSEAGWSLDAGPFVAALEFASGVEATVVGKPARDGDHSQPGPSGEPTLDRPMAIALPGVSTFMAPRPQRGCELFVQRHLNGLTNLFAQLTLNLLPKLKNRAALHATLPHGVPPSPLMAICLVSSEVTPFSFSTRLGTDPKRLGFFLTRRVSPSVARFPASEPRKARFDACSAGQSTTTKSEIRVKDGIRSAKEILIGDAA